jgi:mRNA turnover protein 4
VRDNLRHVSAKIEGEAGIFFTNRAKKEVVKYFKNFSRTDFAKSGAIAPETVVIQPGHIEAFSPYCNIPLVYT